MWYIKILILTGLLLCCGCNPTPTSTPIVPITPTFTPVFVATSTLTTSEATLSETPTVSTPRPTSTPRNIESMWLDFATPISGDKVSAPIRFRGRTNFVPRDPTITVRLYDQNWNLLAETTSTLQGEIGKTGTFSGEITANDYTGTAILVVESDESGASNTTRITIRKP